ncbi:MAG: hypothetical protein EA403_13855 [Spirochaetaceae bacterium]|nr:MAG: hypothetical protein EA403_13855 [Spirochaetaceae bacterium]
MDEVLRIERIVLLGLVTLLGATGTLLTALAGLTISAAAALAVCGVNAVVRITAGESPFARWSLLISVGFIISWLLASLAPFVVVVPDGAILFLQLAGVSPIVFYAVAQKVSARDALIGWAQFGVLLLTAGVVREVFGRGTIAGYLAPGGFVIPADFFASPMGAFLVVGAVVLGARVAVRFATNGGGKQ